jgi:signal transduction histidine kinase/CheY-like chemotaxis protein
MSTILQPQVVDSISAEATSERELVIYRESVRFRAVQSVRAAISILVASIAVICVMHGRVPLSGLLWWGAIMLISNAWRLAESVVIGRRVGAASELQLRRFDQAILIDAIAGSFAVGTCYWLSAVPGDIYVRLVITLMSMIYIMCGFVHATTNDSHAILRPSGIVIQGVLFWLGIGSGGEPHWEIISGYFAMVLMAIGFNRVNRRTFLDSMRIRDENAALLLQLAREKRVVESALQEARLANESKSRFLAAASHDLRQPLHALTMFLGTMSFHVTTQDARRLLGRITDTVRILEEQFNSLLDLSRFDVGAVVAEVRPFRLDVSVARLIDEFRPIAEAKGLTLSAEIAPAMVRTDPILLARLLRNLLDNAVKYTASGSVTVRAVEMAQSYRVDVVDTGPGIPTDQQTRIFDEYVQLANPARQRQHGVGLGLAIVKRIDTLLGLSLALRSTQGHGALFSVVVPAAAHDDVDSHLPVAPLSAPHGDANYKTSAAVWILEDDPLALESLQEQLKAWGAAVTPFTRPEDLIAELREGAALPKWILTDDMLGSALSGLETAQTLSQRYGLGNVCVITGNTEPSRMAELRSSGFPVIVKPADPGKLFALISG